MIVIDENVRQQLSATEYAEILARAAVFDKLVDEHGKGRFQPFASYDQSLDCIRVVVRDCSVTEFRINQWITVLHDNDPTSEPSPIGFTMKGIRAQLSKNGEMDGVVKLTELFDSLVKLAPTETMLHIVSMLKKLTQQRGIDQVQLKQAA